MTPTPTWPTRSRAIPEPSLQELLDDPTIRLLMKADGMRVDDLTDFLALVRKRLIAERWRRAA